jgi:hypothetical protein
MKSLFLVEVKPADVPFVVPIESKTHKVGADFVRDLATKTGGDFVEDPPDIGLLNDFSVLKGPEFDPALVDPLIHEFYEHTTRFTLDVVPHWRLLYRPAFWIFRHLFAEEIGQFNLPFDVHEARQGLESHIDTIDFNHDKVIDLRGWVRVYRQSRLPIYVGIYTTTRIGDRPYVSVGFPFPFANLTATLRPTNVGSRLILRTDPEAGTVSGDYISLLDPATQRLEVFRIRDFHEEIEVFVEGGQLLTHHRFYFIGGLFLTLVYTIHRKPAGAPAAQKLPLAQMLPKAPTLASRGAQP